MSLILLGKKNLPLNVLFGPILGESSGLFSFSNGVNISNVDLSN